MVTFSSRHFALGEFYKWIHLTVVSRKVLLEKGSPFFFFFFCLQHLKWVGRIIHMLAEREIFRMVHMTPLALKRALCLQVDCCILLISAWMHVHYFLQRNTTYKGVFLLFSPGFGIPRVPLVLFILGISGLTVGFNCGEFLSPLFKLINCS